MGSQWWLEDLGKKELILVLLEWTGCPGSGGITSPENVQKPCGYGTWEHGLVGMLGPDSLEGLFQPWQFHIANYHSTHLQRPLALFPTMKSFTAKKKKKGWNQ